ncbi:MAG: NADPH-dependent FMN reductase [Bacilli bacterium]
MKWFIINSSASKNGNCQQLIQWIEEHRLQNDAFEAWNFVDNPIPLYHPTNQDTVPEVVITFYAKIAACDKIVIVCPDYHGGMSGILKNAFDWCSSDHWTDKAVAVLSVAGGMKGGLGPLQQTRATLRALGAWTTQEQVALSGEEIATLHKNEPLQERILKVLQQVVLLNPISG